MGDADHLEAEKLFKDMSFFYLSKIMKYKLLNKKNLSILSYLLYFEIPAIDILSSFSFILI